MPGLFTDGGLIPRFSRELEGLLGDGPCIGSVTGVRWRRGRRDCFRIL